MQNPASHGGVLEVQAALSGGTTEKDNEMTNTAQNPQLVNAAPTGPPPFDGIDIDLAAWRATAAKLSLRETGELLRSIIRAHASVRPNREQRMLLAIFTRLPDDCEVAS